MTKARVNADNASADIQGVTAGTGLSGGGTSGTVTLTNGMATIIDAKGDLVGGTGADAFARLAVGANGTVLTADSVETTGLKWATPSAGGSTFKGASVYNSVNQSTSNGTLTIATFDTENFDTDGFHSTSTNTGRMTIPVGLGGKYLVTFNMKWTGAASATARVAYLRKNAGSLGDFIFQNSVNAPAIWSRSAIVNLAEGDYIYLEIYQESGGSLDFQGTSFMYDAFSIQYLGA
jgi:hypothetical protein